MHPPQGDWKFESMIDTTTVTRLASSRGIGLLLVWKAGSWIARDAWITLEDCTYWWGGHRKKYYTQRWILFHLPYRLRRYTFPFRFHLMRPTTLRTVATRGISIQRSLNHFPSTYETVTCQHISAWGADSPFHGRCLRRVCSSMNKLGCKVDSALREDSVANLIPKQERPTPSSMAHQSPQNSST